MNNVHKFASPLSERLTHVYVFAAIVVMKTAAVAAREKSAMSASFTTCMFSIRCDCCKERGGAGEREGGGER